MELQTLLDNIDDNRKQIESSGKFEDEVLNKIQYKFRLDWNYYSNKMEGGTLTRQETRSVMVGNVTVGGKPIKDVLEMKGHDNVVIDILKIGKGEIRISEKRIKDIHKAIMHEENPEHTKLIGDWKKEPNEIINYKGEKISFANPGDVAQKMHDLLNKTNASLDKYFNGSKDSIHPLLLAADFHLDYVTIHPFYDGNGRTTRILTNLILISCGYPPVIIKETDKTIYYQYLADIQAYGGDRNLFYEFMANRLLDSQKLVLDAIEGKDIEESDDVKKEIELLKKQLASKNFSKSPKIIYDIFLSTQKEVWQKIQETLKSFDEFFNESKTWHFVNHHDEDFGTRKVNALAAFSLTREESNKPKDPKVFGHSIYENDICDIEWKHNKLGLKGATKKAVCEIRLTLEFHQTEYEMVMSLNYNSIFSKKFNYSSYAGLDEVESLKTLLSKALVKTIKENTQE